MAETCRDANTEGREIMSAWRRIQREAKKEKVERFRRRDNEGFFCQPYLYSTEGGQRFTIMPNTWMKWKAWPNVSDVDSHKFYHVCADIFHRDASSRIGYLDAHVFFPVRQSLSVESLEEMCDDLGL